MARRGLDNDEQRAIPSNPVGGDGSVFDVVRRVRLADLALHLRRMALVSVFVGAGLSVVSLYLSTVGIDRCARAPQARGGDDEICRHLRWYPLSVQLRSDLSTKNGVPHGPRAEWYPNGVLWIAGSYDDGEKTGVWREWWPSGAPLFEGRYQDDELVGLERWWYESGTPEWEVGRERGRRDGVERWWFPSGALRRTGHYERGEKHGTFVVFNEDGAEAFRARYDRGMPVGGGLERD